jgi:hypothetical protein
VKTLKYGDKVEITGLATVAVPYSGDTERFPDTLMPKWVRFSAGGTDGYLPVSSLASEWLMGNQDPKASINADGTMSAKKK